MRRLVVVMLFLLAGLLVAPVAYGGALVSPDHWKYQQWLDGSKAPAPPGRILFSIEDCAMGWVGVSCAFDDDPDRIHLAPAAANDPGVFHHEVGHVFDFQVMTPRDRRTFSKLIGRAGQAWDAGAPRRTLELFAAAYANCATGGDHGHYGWAPTKYVQRRSCDLIFWSHYRYEARR
jgi:hypothetical protein